MIWQEYYLKMNYLVDILKKGNTGNANSIARRLNVSRRTIFRYFDELREYGADISYSKSSNSYFLQNDFSLSEYFT